MMKARFLAVLAVVGLFAAWAISVARATSDTQSQNPELTVSVSLFSNGSDPNVATLGNTITATESVKNNTTVPQTVRVDATLVYPNGKKDRTSQVTTLAPGDTATQTQSYLVDRSFQKGTYSLIVSATNADGTSTAKASIAVKK